MYCFQAKNSFCLYWKHFCWPSVTLHVGSILKIGNCKLTQTRFSSFFKTILKYNLIFFLSIKGIVNVIYKWPSIQRWQRKILKGFGNKTWLISKFSISGNNFLLVLHNNTPLGIACMKLSAIIRIHFKPKRKPAHYNKK